MDNSIGNRQDFELAYRLFKNTFKDAWAKKTGNKPEDFDPVNEFFLTQSRIRLEQPFVTTTSLYNFPVLANIQNQGQKFGTEVRLNQQDTFVPTRVGIYVVKPLTADKNDDVFELNAYLNPFIFANAATMQNLYNGVMNMIIGKTQYMSDWPVGWHECRPETQQTAAAGAGSPIDQFEGNQSGLQSMQPFILLIGTENINLTINLVNACSAVDANSRIVIVFDGVLAANSTPLVA